jgi:hypothetical protein
MQSQEWRQQTWQEDYKMMGGIIKQKEHQRAGGDFAEKGQHRAGDDFTFIL